MSKTLWQEGVQDTFFAVPLSAPPLPPPPRGVNLPPVSPRPLPPPPPPPVKPPESLVVSAIADIPEKSTIDDTSVKAAADKTAHTIEKATDEIRKVSSIDRVLSALAEQPDLLQSPPPISQDEVEAHEAYLEIASDLLQRVARYRDKELDPVVVNRDLLEIQSLLVLLSLKMAFFQGREGHAEAKLELVRAKLYLGARQASQQDGMKITETDAKEISKSLAAEVSIDYRNLGAISKYVAGVYYSVKDFVEILDRAAGREFHVNNSPRQA